MASIEHRSEEGGNPLWRIGRFPSIGNGNHEFFQALEKGTLGFSNAWKNKPAKFQGLETWVKFCSAGGARRVGDPAYNKATPFDVSRVSDSAEWGRRTSHA